MTTKDQGTTQVSPGHPPSREERIRAQLAALAKVEFTEDVHDRAFLCTIADALMLVCDLATSRPTRAPLCLDDLTDELKAVAFSPLSWGIPVVSAALSAIAARLGSHDAAREALGVAEVELAAIRSALAEVTAERDAANAELARQVGLRGAEAGKLAEAYADLAVARGALGAGPGVSIGHGAAKHRVYVEGLEKAVEDLGAKPDTHVAPDEDRSFLRVLAGFITENFNPTKVVWKTMSGVHTFRGMALELEQGSADGRQFTRELMMVVLNFMSREAIRQPPADGGPR